MAIKVIGLYLIELENNILKGVVKFKYFEQIIPDNLKYLLKKMSDLEAKKFELDLEGYNINSPETKDIQEHYDSLEDIFQKESAPYFFRLVKIPSEQIKITPEMLISESKKIESIAEAVWKSY